MNILLTIHHTLNPDAGAEGVTLELACAYRRMGHDVEVFAYDHLPERMSTNVKRLLFPYYVQRFISRRKEPFDVVDASSGDAWFWARAARTASRRVTTLITRSHGLEHLSHQVLKQMAGQGLRQLSWKYPLYHGGFRLWEVEQSFRLADGSVMLNEAELAYGKNRFGLERPVVIGNGISDCFLGRPVEIAPLSAADPLRIAVVGRYDPLKGTVYAAEALTAFMLAQPNVHVAFLGTRRPSASVMGDYPAELHPRIGVVPQYPHRELPKLLKGFHIKLFPSLKEGLGMALIEGMACGLAPVTTAIPGPSDVVSDGENGLVVPPGDAGELLQALEKLASDRELLARLRRGAWQTAQRFNWEDIASRTLDYYGHCKERQDKLPMPRSV